MSNVTKILFLEFLAIAMLSACQPSSNKDKAADNLPAFTQTTYWMSSAFLDAVATDSDTLSSAMCMELHFRFKDSVLVVNCESDAMLSAYKVIDEQTLEITSGFGDELKPRISAAPDGGIVLSGVYDQAIHFRPFENPDKDPRGLSIKLMGQHLAGTYASQNKPNSKIVFSPDGKISGMGEYTLFETAIGGDLAATDGNMIYFISDKGEMPCAWKKRGDTLTLWKLKNVSAPDEKPWYEVDGEYDTLVKK
ncbi:hypothetical protein [Haliscomenobacter hydrossis]|uniref:Uncharacterized protein n=1 Tax=Haliscomenobacter hydrossis (strain ATCC 27775 / DSM 1100 / LMG 10767 / O) TaxID=760192 RepID=F4KQY7_HALH1|nr:hypothetical protein [Haliscomenobacter hydrossis]AEE52272.1 hypothetical protein Halhy_4430 [Haliscomenobacter hydrossis DSM 1100]